MAKELKYRIVVVGQRAALTALKKFQRVAVGIFKGIGRAWRIAFPVGVIAGLVRVFARLAAVKVAANIEQLRVRLEAATGSADRAAKALKKLQQIAGISSFGLEELVRAKIVLEGVGVAGEKAFKGIADAASAMDEDIDAVALAVVSMSTQSLRALGVSLKKTKDQFTFTFRDTAGEEIEKVVEGINDARSALVDIFTTKYGGATADLNKTLFGQLDELADKFKSIIANIGEQLLPAVRNAFTGLNEFLDLVAASGLLSSPGGIGTILSGVGDIILAAFREGGDYVARKIREAFGGTIVGKGMDLDQKTHDAVNAFFRRLFGTTNDGGGGGWGGPDNTYQGGQLDAAKKRFMRTLRGTIPGRHSFGLPTDSWQTGDAAAAGDGGLPPGYSKPSRGLMKGKMFRRLGGFGGEDAMFGGRPGFRRSPKAMMLERMGAAGGRNWQRQSLEDMVGRGRGVLGRGFKPGEAKSSPLFVEEVKPESRGLV